MAQHLSERQLDRFYARWFIAPELVDDEFDGIHLHLLDCEDCAALAKQCEDRCRDSARAFTAAAA